MSMGERFYTGNGSGVVAHSICRKRTTCSNERTGSPGRHISPGRHAGSLRGPRRRFQSTASTLSNSSTCSPVKLSSTSFSSISSSSPHLPSSSPSHRPRRHLPETPNKRLDLALDKFSNIALPFYLQIISCHTSNIAKLLQDCRHSQVSAEVERASRSVRQLGSLLFEMEVLRSFLETESEVKYFDKRVMPCKIRAYVAIQKLKAVCPSNSSTTKTKPAPRSVSLTSCNKPVKSSMMRSHSISDSSSVPSSLIETATLPLTRTQSESGDHPTSCNTRAPSPASIVNQTNQRLRNSQFRKSPESSPKTHSVKTNVGTEIFTFEVNNCSRSCGTLGGAGTLEVLYEDPQEDLISPICEDDVITLISDDEQSDEAPTTPNPDSLDQTNKAWKLLEEEISDICILMNQFSSKFLDGRYVNEKQKSPVENVEDSCQDQREGFSTSKVYPMAGAILGTCLGGPVGFLAGIKIGGLAAVGGSIFGYSTGSIIKEHAQRKEFIDDFYANHPNTRRASVRAEMFGLQSSRAVSLPDVLEDMPYSGYGYHNHTGR